eukprot:TRINITY_DN4579_c0_g1_i1.p1 TRINITY_DN4579_c0_g1~~TRINITY_DN4579_c0_g1_i1.p1  ORF type:complete len:370 (+),score=21.03 TRINITY_DN4579_c0_g1_i1:130-1239(+)
MDKLTGLWNGVKAYFWPSGQQNPDADEDEKARVALERRFRSAHLLGDSIENLSKDIVFEMVRHVDWREILLLSFSTKRLRATVESLLPRISRPMLEKVDPRLHLESIEILPLAIKDIKTVSSRLCAIKTRTISVGRRRGRFPDGSYVYTDERIFARVSCSLIGNSRIESRNFLSVLLRSNIMIPTTLKIAFYSIQAEGIVRKVKALAGPGEPRNVPSGKWLRDVRATIQLQLFESFSWTYPLTNSERRRNLVILIYDPTDEVSLGRLAEAIKPNPAATYHVELAFTLLLGISTSTPFRQRRAEVTISQARQWAIDHGVDLFLGDLSYPSDGQHQDSPWSDVGYAAACHDIISRAAELVVGNSTCYYQHD